MNVLFSLERCGEDNKVLRCPKCGTPCSVHWRTVSGDPCVGEYSDICPVCGEVISFGCYIEYFQYPSK